MSKKYLRTWEKSNIGTNVYKSKKMQNEKDGDLGYPSTVELDDGSLMTVYYQKYEDDKKTSLLYTKWRLKNKSIKPEKK